MSGVNQYRRRLRFPGRSRSFDALRMTTIKMIGVARRLTRTAVGVLLIVLTTDETDDERYFRSGTGRSTGLRSEIFWPGARWNHEWAGSDCGRAAAGPHHQNSLR